MTLKDSRTKFAIAAQTTMTVKSHTMSDKVFSKQLWGCPERCTKIDSIFHIKTCNEYEEYRIKHNYLETEEDEIHYFQDIIKHSSESQARES